MTSFTISAHVAHLVHTVLLNFSKDYKSCLIQMGNSLVALLSDETEKREGTQDAGVRRLLKPAFQYSTSPVLDAEDPVQFRSVEDPTMTKKRSSYRSIYMIPDDLGYLCTTAFGAKTYRNVELNCFRTVKYYMYAIRKDNDVSGLRDGLPWEG